MSFFGSLGVTFDFSGIEHTGVAGREYHARGTPTKLFLEAAECLLHIYDKLGSVGWKLVKNDFETQIKTIKDISNTDGVPGQTFQSMILYEVKRNTHTDINSAANALSWLCQHLTFINRLFEEFCHTEYDVYTCLDISYSASLKTFHNFFEKGAVMLALRSAPTREELIRSLQPGISGTPDENMGDSEMLLKSQMTEYSRHLSAQLAKLKKLFISLGLEDAPQ
eukprot:CFRG3971T1